MEDLRETIYIIGLRLYRDRAKRVTGLSQSLYLKKVLKLFNIISSKKELLPIRYGIHLSKKNVSKDVQG